MGDLAVSAGSTAFMCILYVALGVVSVLCSLLNLTIWLSSRELRRKCLYLSALEACELINGISYILVGTGRGMGLVFGYLSSPISVRQCYFDKYWPHSLILGTELPSFCIILIATERLCAVLRPATYNRIFMGKYKLVILCAVPVAGTASVAIAGVSIMGSAGEQKVSSQHCAIINSTAIWYSTFHFVFIVLAYMISFVSLFTVWRISSKFSRMKFGGDNRIGIMLIITGTSVLLVGSESIVMLFIRWNVATFSDVVVALTYAMPGSIQNFLSILNTVVNLLFRPEFRKHFLILTHLRDRTTVHQSVFITPIRYGNATRTIFTDKQQTEKTLVF